MRSIIASCLLSGVALLAMASSALATGKHITCPFVGSINNGTPGGNTRIEHTMSFYLDDTHSTLVGEGGDVAQGTSLNVRTESYSDTWIDAEISTGMPDGVMFFDQIANGGRASLGIDRLTGRAAYAVKLLPRGAETGAATCHEVTAPAAKF